VPLEWFEATLDHSGPFPYENESDAEKRKALTNQGFISFYLEARAGVEPA